MTSSRPLTPREHQIARLFALGQTWEAIMAELGISRHTVAFHRQSFLAKSGGGTLIDAFRARGWLRIPDHMAMPDSTPRRESPVAAVTPASPLRQVI